MLASDSNMNTPLLELRGVTKYYQNGDLITPVLHGIDLKIFEGEFVALMGPSGSGKSTLMHIMSFLDRMSSGEYYYRGRSIVNLSDADLAKLRLADLGFIFQAFHLLPKLTVLENTVLPLVYAGVSYEQRMKRGRQALAEVGLSERLDYFPSQLSGGQKQRTAIARALINNPKMIFADEPTGNLDSVSSHQVLEILRDLSQQGRTVVMVTHEQEAADYAGRTVRIRDGKII